ncbi:MAG: OmpA family protein [Acidobacteria bacterium]|nr:MAG: OmpA family protein [Acidobacteriota bacterium]
MKKIWTLMSVALIFCCASLVSVYAQNETEVKGMITGRTGDTVTVRTSDGNQVIILTDATKVQSPKGLGLRKKQMSWAQLIPGLKIKVKATQGVDGKLEAKTITFGQDDLQTANMIQAGLVPTQQNVEANRENIAENKQNISANRESISVNQANIAANKAQIAENDAEVSRRFSDLADYDVKHETTVYFASGKSTIAKKDQDELSKLATGAAQFSGYIIEVKGFADSTGNAAANQTLSKDRAYAVVNYLMQQCNVAPRRIVSPGAMGISNPASSNETSQGRAENRRVEVKVMVNKGITTAAN